MQFILGGAGSGKTRVFYDRATRESMEHLEQKYLVMVPEQLTMQTQEEVIRLHPRHRVINIDILNPKRLAHRVFEDLGVRTPVMLDDMGKSTALHKAVGSKRGKLSLYSGHLKQTGFIGQLKLQISEPYQYDVTPDILRDVRGETDPPLLTQKLEDLEVVYSNFREYIKSYYTTAGEILGILYREPPRWESLKDSIILLDGYTSFTPVQHKLVELFLVHAREVVCTVTIDSREDVYKEGGIQHLSHMSRHTVCHMASVAKQYGIPKREDIIYSRCPAWGYDESPELDFLGQNLYRYSGRTWEEKEEHIQVYRGRNPAEEVAYVCSRIE